MSAKTNAKSSSKPTTGNSLANTAAQVQGAVTANLAAGTVARRPAVAITNGTIAVQTQQGTQTVQLTGACAGMHSLPATNPALRGTVGNVKQGAAMLAVGNGKQPRSPHGQAMYAAIVAALPCTAQQAAQAAGSGGAAFVTYALKHGWFTQG